jgi:hypothetical protein
VSDENDFAAAIDVSFEGDLIDAQLLVVLGFDMQQATKVGAGPDGKGCQKNREWPVLSAHTVTWNAAVRDIVSHCVVPKYGRHHSVEGSLTRAVCSTMHTP